MKIKIKNGLILFSIVTAMIALAIACKTAQPYKQPADAVNDKLYRNAVTADTNTIASIPWKQMFSDTLLQKLIEEGINNNLDLKVAVARIKAAAANFKQSKLALLPNIDGNAAATFQRVPPTQFGVPEAYQLYVNASWEADIWGKLGSARRAAYASLLQSDAYKRAVQTQLIADIASNYYSLMAYDCATFSNGKNSREQEERSGNDGGIKGSECCYRRCCCAKRSKPLFSRNNNTRFKTGNPRNREQLKCVAGKQC